MSTANSTSKPQIVALRRREPDAAPKTEEPKQKAEKQTQKKKGSTTKPKKEQTRTEQKQPESSKKRTPLKAIIRELIALFPNCFTSDPALIKPLRMNIHVDILKRAEFRRRSLWAALGIYTSSPHYLEAILRETHRIDIDGNPIEEISEKNKQIVAMRLAQMKEGKQDDTKET